MKIKIVEKGAFYRIRIDINGIYFYSAKDFESIGDAKEFLKKNGLQECQ